MDEEAVFGRICKAVSTLYDGLTSVDAASRCYANISNVLSAINKEYRFKGHESKVISSTLVNVLELDKAAKHSSYGSRQLTYLIGGLCRIITVLDGFASGSLQNDKALYDLLNETEICIIDPISPRGSYKYYPGQFVVETTDVTERMVKKVTHVVHDKTGEILSDVFSSFPSNRIRLKAHVNDDYKDDNLPLVWFGALDESRTSADSWYGILSVTTGIENILVKGQPIYGLGTRKFKNEHCHSFLVTSKHCIMKNRSLITDDKEKQKVFYEKDANSYVWLQSNYQGRSDYDTLDFAVSPNSSGYFSLPIMEVELAIVSHKSKCVKASKLTKTILENGCHCTYDEAAQRLAAVKNIRNYIPYFNERDQETLNGLLKKMDNNSADHPNDCQAVQRGYQEGQEK